MHKVWITEKWFVPVYLTLGHVRARNGSEVWAILSDQPTSLKTLDDKSAGFQLESSEIRNAVVWIPLGTAD